MSETDPNADRAATIERLSERLSGFAQGIGMSGNEAREIIKRVIEADPAAGDGDLLAKARTWMLIALA
ncbi:hypothetical protein [Methylobacterium sp. 13MFTsu3.1M2]|uniref:hypothetical protein n=1 Tax=Methylobacterium sp. 13MFTsu3.1M2 TaxID=1502776 RepID=UPI0008EAA2D4|nr:hypothetical protein [Methylobacterium sp. 13MFTsu3.1M2]SFE66953.1 hypothetical protein SAMN02799627_04020 [Methylobacterium sp. 13MFTsu3.1M2]